MMFVTDFPEETNRAKSLKIPTIPASKKKALREARLLVQKQNPQLFPDEAQAGAAAGFIKCQNVGARGEAANVY